MRQMIRTLSMAALTLGLAALLAAPASACDGQTKSDSQSSSSGK